MAMLCDDYRQDRAPPLAEHAIPTIINYRGKGEESYIRTSTTCGYRREGVCGEEEEKMKSPLVAACAILAPTTQASWEFRSRPDLAPPRLNITIPAHGTDAGYLFIAPFAGHEDTATRQYGPRQAGPYIFRDDGDLIWSSYGNYFSIWAANFQKITYKGKDALASFTGDHNPNYGHGHGHIILLDQHYEHIRHLKAGKAKISDKHEFTEIGGKTGLIQIYQPVPRDLTPYGAKEEQQWIVDAIIQELDLETGKVLFEWHSLDHVTPHESVLPVTKGQAGSGYNSSDAWDYFHINSVDKDEAGNYIVSARDACSVHKINGSDGSIIWRLDGKKSDFAFGKGVKFCFQHHARWLQQDNGDGIEVISLYDNAAHGTEADHDHGISTAPTSSGKIIHLNTTSWKADLVQGFYPPKDYKLLSKSQGSTQIQPSGNVLVNWGSEGAITEYAANGTAIFHAFLDSGALFDGLENYRAYRFNWTGKPSEDPAIITLTNAHGCKICVSWNGDTETKTWKFFERSSVDASESEGENDILLGEAERKSFETVLNVPGRNVSSIFAVAIDAHGTVLTTTDIARTETEVLPFRAGGNDHAWDVIDVYHSEPQRPLI